MNLEWQYSTVHNSACKVIEEQTLWGQTVCRVWLPNSDSVVRVPASGLIPLASRPSSLTTDHIAYVAAAAKVAEVLEGSTSATEGHVLLAPMESNVIPLPHQIHALSRAISGDRVRYLLADEVGPGKTIEAGLVMRELKLRGLVRRILVVSPKGIATQWVAEMQPPKLQPPKLRRAELQQMQEYVARPFGQHMGFLIDALDGESSTVSPPSLPPLPEDVDQSLIREAEEFLCRTSLPIEPRKKWSAGGMPQYGIHTASNIPYQAQPGKALCVWGDAGWGGMVRQGKYHDGHFSMVATQKR